MRLIGGLAMIIALGLAPMCFAAEEEAVLDEVIVEAPFDVQLGLPRESHVRIMIDRLNAKAETDRVLELKIANRTILGNLLDLTKYSPIKFGVGLSGSEEFFQLNYMRADLNPRLEDALVPSH